MTKVYPIQDKLRSYLEFFDIVPNNPLTWMQTTRINALVSLGQQLGINLPYQFTFYPGQTLWSELLMIDLRILNKYNEAIRSYHWSEEDMRTMGIVNTLLKEPPNWPDLYDWPAVFATFYYTYSPYENDQTLAELRWNQSAKWDTEYQYLPAALNKCAYVKLASA